MTVTPPKKIMSARRSSLGTVLLLLGAAGCGRGDATTARKAEPPPAGAVTIDVVRVIEQPLNVELSLPGELTPYQSVAIYPRVTGFVKTVRVDRGSRVRIGDVIAILDAPELMAQRSEAQSKLHVAEAQLAGARSKADSDRSTYDKLKAASATPGVVAGNDVLIAEKAADASQNQVVAGQQNVEAARQALNAIREMEGYLRVTAPFSGVVTERNVHPGALVGPASGSGASVPMVRVVEDSRLRLVVPVPEAYTAELKAGTEISFSVAAYPGQTWTGTVARIAHTVDLNTRTMAVELAWPTGTASSHPARSARSAGPSVGLGRRCSCQAAVWPRRPIAPSSCVFAAARRSG